MQICDGRLMVASPLLLQSYNLKTQRVHKEMHHHLATVVGLETI
jgi:hypothetical protein